MLKAPISRKIYISCDYRHEHAIRVRRVDSGEDHYIRPATLEEAIKAPVAYILVDYPLEWPYDRYDLEGIPNPNLEIDGFNSEPLRWAQAALVATPQMALI